MIIPPI